MPWTRRTGGCVCTGGRASTAADHRRDAGRYGFVNLLRTNEMNMGVNAARRHDHMLPSNDFGARSNDYRYPRLDVRISCLPDSGNTTALYSHIRFDNAPMIDDHGIRDHCIHGVFARTLRLAHAITDNFAAPEFDLFSVNRVVAFDLGDKLGIG